MEVAQYTFQSPSASAVQVGRLDPSSVKAEKETPKQAPQQSQQNAVQAKTVGEIFTKDTSAAAQVSPTVSQNHLLDVYA